MNSVSAELCLAVAQFAMTEERARNIARAGELVREAAAAGARVVLLPELFEHPYFPKEKKSEFFALAQSARKNRAVAVLRELAQRLEVVVTIPFFEKQGDSFYNSVAVADADGCIKGIYRKSHIPDGPGYWEKHYFKPGDTGFTVFATRYAKLGLGICWDQWFPEGARILTLLGADVLLYPSAIGSEPDHPSLDTRDSWQRVMMGQAAANAVAVAAANRIGTENGQRFYGSSFIADHRGEKLSELGRDQQGVITARLNLDEMREYRQWFGLLGDRRPELYAEIVKKKK